MITFDYGFYDFQPYNTRNVEMIIFDCKGNDYSQEMIYLGNIITYEMITQEMITQQMLNDNYELNTKK